MDYDGFTSFTQLSYLVLEESELCKLCDTDLYGCLFWASKFRTDAAKINLRHLKEEYAFREMQKEVEADVL